MAANHFFATKINVFHKIKNNHRLPSKSTYLGSFDVRPSFAFKTDITFQ
jgi:hypothetical protein